MWSAAHSQKQNICRMVAVLGFRFLLLFCIFSSWIGNNCSGELVNDDTCHIQMKKVINLVAKCSNQRRNFNGDELESIRKSSVSKEENYLFADLNKKVDELKTNLHQLKTASERNFQKITKLLECISMSASLTTLPNGKKYFFSLSTPLTWFEAKEFCEKRNMQLASPKTQQDISLLHQKAKEINPYTNWWFSASDVGQLPGEYQWLDGTPLAKNSEWWYTFTWKEPDQYGQGQKTCVGIHTGYPEKLFDNPCANKDLFVCELSSACH